MILAFLRGVEIAEVADLPTHGLEGSGAYPFALSLESGKRHLSFGLWRWFSFASSEIEIGAVARCKQEPGFVAALIGRAGTCPTLFPRRLG